MKNPIHLSKSKLISGWQCPKRLWLEKNAPELIEYSSATQAAFAAVANLFNLGRHLVSAGHYRNLRIAAFAKWNMAVA